MEFQKLIETRRTVRKYAADSEVTREQMETLIHAAQEAPSWKNSQTGRYYCVLSREIVDKIRATCLPGAGNAGKSENAALIVQPSYMTAPVSRKMVPPTMNLETDGDAMILVCRMKT